MHMIGLGRCGMVWRRGECELDGFFNHGKVGLGRWSGAEHGIIIEECELWRQEEGEGT